MAPLALGRHDHEALWEFMRVARNTPDNAIVGETDLLRIIDRLAGRSMVEYWRDRTVSEMLSTLAMASRRQFLVPTDMRDIL